MNLVTRLLGFGSSLSGPDANAAELAKIQSGQLFLVRPHGPRSGRECIYKDAMATIRRAPSVEHHFQLVITRVFEDGEEDILDEEEENEEQVFLIAEELRFRLDVNDGEPALVWEDIDGDTEEKYEFIANGSNKATVDFFAQCMYRAMFERKYRSSGHSATDEDLQEFVWQKPDKSSSKNKRPSASTPSQSEDTALVQAMDSLNVSTSGPPASTYPAIISLPSELYLWDGEDGQFIGQGDVSAKITQDTSSRFKYYFVAVTSSGEQLLAHEVTADMNARWSKRLWSVTWNHMTRQGRLDSWCFKFEGEEDFEAFSAAHSKALYEHLNETSWEKAKPKEQEYMMSSFAPEIEMADATEESDDEESVEAALHEEADASEDEAEGQADEEVSDDEEAKPPPMEKGTGNSLLTIGYKNDRTFVVRGDKIGVFKNGQKVEYAATIRDLGFKSKKAFKPKQMMLHDQDTKIVLINPAERHALYSMDIEYGKIVDEWKVHDDITVDVIAPHSKFSQMTGEQTFVGTSHNALFRIDPRMGGHGGTAMAETKQYTTKNKFSALTTTDAGRLAVASEKGDIRLFDTVGKIAKTALPAMGDPIIGIDVTADGRWIVATCKPYLLLIDTLIGDGKFAGQLGFDRSFPADAKPQPKRLQLSPEHAAYMGHNVSFSPARFNVSKDKEENAIVTSTGQHIIAWDFNKVKKGKLDSYVIKRYEDVVVQDSFRFGDDNGIIVALTNDILAVNKKTLKKLPRASLQTPTSKLKTRSSIVNSPY